MKALVSNNVEDEDQYLGCPLTSIYIHVHTHSYTHTKETAKVT